MAQLPQGLRQPRDRPCQLHRERLQEALRRRRPIRAETREPVEPAWSQPPNAGTEVSPFRSADSMACSHTRSDNERVRSTIVCNPSVHRRPAILTIRSGGRFAGRHVPAGHLHWQERSPRGRRAPRNQGHAARRPGRAGDAARRHHHRPRPVELAEALGPFRPHPSFRSPPLALPLAPSQAASVNPLVRTQPSQSSPSCTRVQGEGPPQVTGCGRECPGGR